MPIGSVLHGIAGIAILLTAFQMGEAVSIGSTLGVLLVASACARYFRARGA
ncbi:MAG: hypothetical protein O2924_01505 [Chloroflexi bacterium]|nr:hypothetical protein [Chloroflexota bacterium]